MTILVADPSRVARSLLNSTLTSWGFQTVLATNGAQAWDLLQQRDAPSLVILEWMMPGLTGLEVCRKVRELGREPYTYILLITSRSLKENLIEGMEAGADDYIVKPFDRHELNVRLKATVRLIQLQAELVSAREKLRDQASKDGLTGLLNRPAISEVLNMELARSRSDDHNVGVLWMDLDNFKTVVDTYGHFDGGQILKKVAERCRDTIRSCDHIGHYGGDEFLVVLPRCDETCLQFHGELLCRSISDTPFDLPTMGISISASFGAVCVPPSSDMDIETLLVVADAALYKAKSRGGNCLIMAPGLR